MEELEINETTEVRDGMRIDWNVPIEMDDGIMLHADVYRPIVTGRCILRDELKRAI